MAGHSSAVFGWSWTEVSVLGSEVFGQALMESCELGQWGIWTGPNGELWTFGLYFTAGLFFSIASKLGFLHIEGKCIYAFVLTAALCEAGQSAKYLPVTLTLKTGGSAYYDLFFLWHVKQCFNLFCDFFFYILGNFWTFCGIFSRTCLLTKTLKSLNFLPLLSYHQHIYHKAGHLPPIYLSSYLYIYLDQD